MTQEAHWNSYADMMTLRKMLIKSVTQKQKIILNPSFVSRDVRLKYFLEALCFCLSLNCLNLYL